MNARNLSGLLLTLFTLVVLGCSSGGGDGGGGVSPNPVTTTLSGEVSKGPLIGGDVRIYAIKADGTLQSTALPTADGKPVTTKLPFGNYSAVINYEGPVKVVVTGGSYTDEATGSTVDFSGKSLSAVVANVTGSVKVSVTPFTEMAVQKAGTTLTTAGIKAANAAVAIALGLQDVDIVATTPSGNPAYKSKLAVFSQAVKDKTTDVATLSAQTASAIDIATGTITSPDVSTTYTTAATNAFNNPLINQPGNIPVVDGSALSGVTLTSSATAPPKVGDNIIITAVVTTVSGGPAADGTVVTFTPSAGTVLTVTPTLNGIATATLSGINTPQTVSVRAVAGVVKSPEINVNFVDPLSNFIITVKDNPGAHFISDSVPISVNVVNLLNVPASNRTVNFAVTSGSGNLSSTSATTDANGNASVTLTSSVEGPAIVTITVDQAIGSHTITFNDSNKPGFIELVKNRSTGVTNNLGPVVLTATLIPGNIASGTIVDGTPVTFTIVGGTGGTLSSPTATTKGGVASVTLNSTDAGSIDVTAKAGSTPVITSNTLRVTFTSQPTQVTVKVRTTGTLPAGTTIGGLKATVTADSASGLTIIADPNGSSSDISATGAGVGSTLITNSNNVAAVTLALVNTNGIQTGEFATLNYNVVAGSFPKPGDFKITLNGAVIDALSTPIPGIGVEILSVTIQ